LTFLSFVLCLFFALFVWESSLHLHRTSLVVMCFNDEWERKRVIIRRWPKAQVKLNPANKRLYDGFNNYVSGTQKSRLFILDFSSCRLPSGCYSAIATKNLQVASADVASLKSLELLSHIVFKLPNLIPGQRFCDLIHFRHEQGVRFNYIFGQEIPF